MDVYGTWARITEQGRALLSASPSDRNSQDLASWSAGASEFLAQHGGTLDRWYGTGASETVGAMIDRSASKIREQNPGLGSAAKPDYLGEIFSQRTAADMVGTAETARRRWWAEGGGATVLMVGVGAFLYFAFRK